jgi:opacity protein-like surface antigen
MKNTFIVGLAASYLLAFCLSAQASDHRSFYIGLKGDIADPADSDIKGAATGKVKYGFSSGAGGVLGWEPEVFASKDGDLRFELEGSYHAFGLDTVAANNNPSGDMQVTALMANLYYDWHINKSWSPYIGIGMGQANVKFGTGQGLGNTDDNDTVTAWQAMAGLSYTARSMPNTDWSLGYKYLDLNQPSFSSAGGDIKLDPVHEHTIEMGVNYHF